MKSHYSKFYPFDQGEDNLGLLNTPKNINKITQDLQIKLIDKAGKIDLNFLPTPRRKSSVSRSGRKRIRRRQ